MKFPRVLGIEAVGVVEQRREASFARAISSRPRWAAWDGSSTAATPNTPACPRAGAGRQDRTPLGNARSHPGDAANGVGLAVQVASSRKRRASADPRRHDLGWVWRPRPSLKATAPSSPRRRATRPRKTAAGQRRRSGVYRYRLDRRTGQGGLPETGSTRCSNWSARRH